MVFIPAVETVARFAGRTVIPAAPVLVQHLTLWIGFIGAMQASRAGKMLALTTIPLFDGSVKIHWGKLLAKSISFIIVAALALAAIKLVLVEFKYPMKIAPVIPRWAAQLIMPVGFSVIALQLLYRSGKRWWERASVIGFAILWFYISTLDTSHTTLVVILGIAGILTALRYGAPIFVGLGGIALFLFWYNYSPISAVSAETYRIVVSPSLPTIPLFTLTGYLLAESKASIRMMNLFRSIFGWIPGGTPIVIVTLCGAFTALTGGSGVTILALGGLLYPLLRNEGYSELFSIGLITVAGSVGLLFPPSLPAIIYGVTAGVSVKDVFLGGLIPGIFLVTLISIWAIYQEKAQGISKQKFEFRAIFQAVSAAKWEVLIPIFILFGIFSGITTLVETAAMTVVYVLVVEMFLYREITVKDLPRILIECATLIGGVLIILGVAMGLTSYLVDAQVPMLLMNWVKDAISSKIIFLLALNILLLGVGCLMDIFSATIVIVPLIAPLGAYFGVHPVHMAVIFIANLELGFLTPPVGMNLFLSAYRFEKSMPELYRATFPFFMVRLLAVLAITYLPFLSLWLVN